MVKNLKEFRPEMPGEGTFSADVISALPLRTRGNIPAIIVTGSVRALRIAAVLLVGLLVVQQYTDYRNQQSAGKPKIAMASSYEITQVSNFPELGDSLARGRLVNELSAKELLSLSMRYSRIKAENQPKLRQMATEGQFF